MPYPEPRYAEKVIVGIVFRSTFAWYVTERDYWYLDYTKYDRALAALKWYTKPVPDDYSWRFDVVILNEQTMEHFLSQIEDRKVPASALTEMMLVQRQIYREYGSLTSNDYREDLLDFSPCFLVDVDRKQFFSLYPEMIAFEKYVPDGWVGAYEDFLSKIPVHERYWIVDGKNLFDGWRNKHI